jgi:hypothetical protein
MKPNDFPTERADHPTHLMGASFAKHQGRRPLSFDDQLSRSGRTIVPSQQKSSATELDGFVDQAPLERNPIALRHFARRVGQPMNEGSVRGQYEQARGGAVQPPRDLEPAPALRFLEQIENQGGLAFVVATGVPRRLVQNEIGLLRRGFDGLFSQFDALGQDPPLGIPTDLSVDPNGSFANQGTGLLARGQPRPGEIRVEAQSTRGV